MLVFHNDPNTPRNYGSILITIAVACLAFWVIMAYLIPQITIEPLHTIIKIGVVILAIVFVFDYFL